MEIDAFSHDEVPYGKTWAEWAQLWWSWMISIPKDKSPNLGNDNLEPNFQLYNNNVIFLSGSYGGFVEHSATVPSGKALLFPVINCINSHAEDPEMKSDQDLISWLEHDIANVLQRDITINNNPIPVQKILTRPFFIEYPINNYFNAEPGLTRAIAGGYWVFLRPLPAGKYEIRSDASCISGRVKINVLHHIIIQ
jgi:hypothetical protein